MNTRTLLFIAFGVMVVAMSFAPLISFATNFVSATPQVADAISIFPKGFWGPILAPDRGDPTRFTLCTFFDTVKRAMYLGLTIALFIVLPLTIMYGGFLVMTAGANAENIGKGKSAVTGSLVGIAVALCAYLLINTFYTFIVNAPANSNLPANVKSKQWYNLSCDFKDYKLLTPLTPTNTTKEAL